MFYQLPPPPPDYSYAYVEQVDICSIDIPYKKLINSTDIININSNINQECIVSKDDTTTKNNFYNTNLHNTKLIKEKTYSSSKHTDSSPWNLIKSKWLQIKAFWSNHITQPIDDAWNYYVAAPFCKIFNEYTFQLILDYLINNGSIPISNLAEDIKNYDKENTSEKKVLSSHFFSSYKNTLIIRLPTGNIGISFGIIFLGHDVTEPVVIKHEYGHKLQFENMGITKYTTDVAIPSFLSNMLSRVNKLPYDYSGSPWESEANNLVNIRWVEEPIPWPKDAYQSYWELIKLFFY